MKITFDEWQKALRDARLKSSHGADGFSAAEFARQMKCGKDAALSRIREMLDAGVVRYVGLSARVDITGRRQMVPVYALVTGRNAA